MCIYENNTTGCLKSAPRDSCCWI